MSEEEYLSIDDLILFLVFVSVVALRCVAVGIHSHQTSQRCCHCARCYYCYYFSVLMSHCAVCL